MLIHELLRLAAEKGASDIHLQADYAPILRIDGELRTAAETGLAPTPLSRADLEKLAAGLLTKDQLARLARERDLDLGCQVGAYRYRVNFSYERGGLAIVARVITEKKYTLEEIGMPPVVQQILDQPQGFILVTGPTGCGKSTTLAAMINHINSVRSCNIVTLEDPIEYLFTPERSIISQRQLGTDMLTFASGLKHVLRQDPNVIMLGEMRDPETIATAVTLAETGHLVLATLHTYNAAQTIDRIVDSFPPHQQGQIKSQLSGVLTAIISQRLLPRTGGGRVAAREILINNAAVANLIREGKFAQIKSVIETHASLGMVTLDRHLLELYQAGQIDREAAERNMEDARLLDSR